MINTYEELKDVTQDLYCIVFRETIDDKERLCYLTRNKKPLFFYTYELAKTYFDENEIATVNDSPWVWKTGKLHYPDARIVKVTLSNFELI